MNKIEPRAVLRLAGIASLGAVMMLSMACKNGGSGSASLPTMSLASTIDQGAVTDETIGVQSLRMMSPSGGQVPVVSLVDAVKEKLGAKSTCVPGEGRGCLDTTPAAGDAKEPHRDVHGKQSSDNSGPANREK